MVGSEDRLLAPRRLGSFGVLSVTASIWKFWLMAFNFGEGRSAFEVEVVALESAMAFIVRKLCIEYLISVLRG